MKKRTLILFSLILFSLCLAACVKESPEPVYTPESIAPEDRELIGTMDSGSFSYALFNDNTCEVLGIAEGAQTESTLNIPEKCDDYTVVAIGNGALANTDFTSVTIPDTVNTIGEGAFRKSAVTEILLPSALRSLGAECFDGCLKLEKITFQSSIETIPTAAFYGCESLTEIDLPEGVKVIEEEAFAALTSLEKIRLPSTLESIGPFAFWSTGTDNLEFDIPENVNQIGRDAFLATTWLKGQTEEFVIVGKGVLLTYRGTNTEVTLPDSVRFLSNAFDRTGVKVLHLNDALESVCESCLEESSVEQITYQGTSDAVKALVTAPQN